MRSAWLLTAEHLLIRLYDIRLAGCASVCVRCNDEGKATLYSVAVLLALMIRTLRFPIDEQDVDATLKWLASVSEPTAAVAGRLRSAMDSGRLCVVENPFFTSPLPFPEMTPVVRGALSSQSVVIVKGDGACC